jgi:hypothetical protein
MKTVTCAFVLRLISITPALEYIAFQGKTGVELYIYFYMAEQDRLLRKGKEKKKIRLSAF